MKSHGRLRRAAEYIRLVARDGFAAGGAIFATSAAYLNLAPTPAGLAAAGLFAAGGAVDALQAVAPAIRAYRRRHHPALAGKMPPDDRPRGALERVLAIPALGQVMLGAGAATVVGQSLAGGAYQAAAGVGLFAAGHATFAGAAIAKALLERRASRRAASANAPTAERLSPDRSPTPTRNRVAEARRTVAAIARDPFAIGGILFGAASATLNLGPTTAGLTAAALCAGGGVAQAVLKHRPPRPPSPAASQAQSGGIRRGALGRVAEAARTAARAAGGYALQAAGLAIAATTAPLPALQLGLGGFTAAMTVFTASSAVTALRARVPPSVPAPASAPAPVRASGPAQTASRPAPQRAAPEAAPPQSQAPTPTPTPTPQNAPVHAKAPPPRTMPQAQAVLLAARQRGGR